MEKNWKHWAKAWEESGQSQKQFCLENELDYSQFKSWRQRAIDHGVCERRWSPSLSQRMGFSELTMHQTEPSTSAEIVLELPHGVTLRIPSDVSCA